MKHFKHRLLLIATLVFASTYCGAQQRQQTGFDISRNLDIFADIYRQLDIYYVDTLSADTAVEWAINGMLSEIDPYTKYYPDDDQEELRMMATGRYAGIGAMIRMPKNSTRAIIDEPYEGQPAHEAGVRAGDVILTIDGHDVEGWEVSRVSKTLRGEPGTTFELRVQRPSEKRPRAFKITRRQVQLPCLPWYGIIDDEAHVGYIYLSEFTDKCSREVRHAILEMKQQGMQRLIFDLRDNGGGAVSEAVEIVGMFVPRGSLVVKTKGKLPSTCHDYLTPAEPIDTVMPVAVMINSNTASASEIVAGALQDLDRALIVGQRSYGKGLVQGIRELPYRGQLKITTARYYIPSGRCIQAYDYRHRTADGAATTLPDSLTHVFYTRLGRPVRDGGGIQPDSVLAVDSVPSMVYDLTASDPFFDFVTEYVQQHPQIAAAGSFHISDEEWQAFTESIKASDFTYNGRTATALKQLRQLARFEGYDEQASSEFEALEAKLSTHDLEADLERFRQHIQPYLETEIVSRYYYQSGALRQTLTFDKALIRTIELINSNK